VIDALTVEDLVYIHRVLADLDGTSHGIRDVAGVRAAVEAPFATCGGEDLYPDLEDKAAAIGHAVTANHPFVDGNKRVGHAAMVMIASG
jgi:death-on-curing protein